MLIFSVQEISDRLDHSMNDTNIRGGRKYGVVRKKKKKKTEGRRAEGKEKGVKEGTNGWARRVERRAAINADVFLRSLGQSDVCSGKCNHAVI